MANKESCVPHKDKKIGLLVRQLRLQQGMSLAELANCSGVSKIHLSRIERLHSSPTEEIIRRLAAAFHVPVSVLFGEQPFLPHQATSSLLEKQNALVTKIRSVLRSRQSVALASTSQALLLEEHHKQLVLIESGSRVVQAPRIKVVGIGEGGIQAIRNMVTDTLPGVEWIVADTKVQEFDAVQEAGNVRLDTLQLGPELAKRVDVSTTLEEKTRAIPMGTLKIQERLAGADIVFLIVNMAEAAGRSGALLIAHLAKQRAAFVAGVVARPHPDQGKKLLRQAETGIRELQPLVDDLLVVPLEKLSPHASEGSTLPAVFHGSDDILSQVVREICEPLVQQRDSGLPQLAVTAPKVMRDNPEGDLLRFLRDHADKLRTEYRLIAPLNTYEAILRTGFFDERHAEKLLRGAEGGILQIGHRVVRNQCTAVLFLCDPRDPKSDSPEFRAVTRVCAEKEIPFLSTPATALSLIGSEPIKGSKSRVPDWVKTATIAFSAHDKKKEEIKELLENAENHFFVGQFKRILATGKTGTLIRGWFPDLAAKVELVSPGRQGGDIELAHEVLEGRCQVAIILTDSHDSPPDAPEIDLLYRTCQLSRVSVVVLSSKKAAAHWLCTARNFEPTLAEQLRMKYGAPDGPLKEVLVVPDEMVSQDLRGIQATTSRFSNTGWGIPRATLVQEIEPAWEAVNRRLASVAACYVDLVLQQERPRAMAISWGKAMFLFTEAIRHDSRQPIEHMTIWPMVGVPSLKEERIHAGTFAELIAAQYKAKFQAIASPLLHERNANHPIDPTEGSRQAMRGELIEATIAVTGVGAVPPEARDEWLKQTPILQLAPQINKAVVRSAIRKGAVGEIGGLFFNLQGHPVDTGWDTLLSHDDLRTMAQKGRVVLVAGGDIRRYPSIKGALRGGFVSVLVTEPEAAKAVLTD